ncbi:MAG: DNA ligase D, partial [Coriobacteriia bacterium]|nr:DNA ligase D [Coriobacteriia bacterium]
LTGSKLTGAWVLVRMKPRPGEKRENWLLIKERDDHVRPRAEYDVLVAEADSAASGRTMEQIASGGVARDTATAPVPLDAPFQLATLVDEAPDGQQWLHEIKYDGYRLQVALDRGRARVITRNRADWTDRFGPIAAVVEALPATSALLDGEAVVFAADGRTDFGALQAALSAKDPGPIVFVAFDVLYLDGFDLRDESLLRRKELLKALADTVPTGGSLRFAEHFTGGGPAFHASACGLLLEGSVSKRGDRPWVGGRSSDWLKAKCLGRQEFVVGGWTDPAGTREGFGALLLGVFDETGALRYAGRVGTGFTDQTLAAIKARLDRSATEVSPFADPPRTSGLHWVRPELVVEVAFREWTRDGVVRQPSFQGAREDADPRAVVRERPDPAPSEPAPADGEAVAAGVTITNPTKVLGPAGIAKGDLARYYETVAPWMMPHLAGRLVTVVRCPHGSGGGAADCFYQKHPEPKGWPDALRAVPVHDRKATLDYFTVEDARALLSLVQLGALEIHVWNSLATDYERPDRFVLDLDPGEGVGFAEVCAAGRIVRDALDALGLAAYPKTTGGRGLHLITPIEVEHDFDAVRSWTHAFVEALSAAHPAVFTARMSKVLRPGRVFVDYLRNAHGATAVCAFSTRARPGVPVSVPVSWEEIDAGLDPAAFDTASVPLRLASLKADPWAGYEASRRPLEAALFAALGLTPPA